MKIDVEGGEQALLHGARGILAERPPRALQIEIYPTEFDAVDRELRQYLPVRRRVAYNTTAGRLVLLEIGSEPLSAELRTDPPIYTYALAADQLGL